MIDFIGFLSLLKKEVKPKLKKNKTDTYSDISLDELSKSTFDNSEPTYNKINNCGCNNCQCNNKK